MDTLTTPPTATKKDLVLTDEQRHAVDLVITWFNDPTKNSPLRLGGYAGTGKTTIIDYILNYELHTDPLDLPLNNTTIRANVCAFTGKACHVLQRKGIFRAQTIHSMIYDAATQPDGSVEFYLRSSDALPGHPNLIIVDEASMVSSDLYRDLLSFNIKLLFIGDPGQLEPVGDNPNLMHNPNYVLTKIHRQAEKSPIITLASQVRNNGPVRLVDPTGAVVIKPRLADASVLASVDQVICGKNATRVLLNNRIRNHFGRSSANPLVVGDKLICLRNNRKFKLFNGYIFFVNMIVDEDSDTWTCCLSDEAGTTHASIPIWKRPFYLQEKFDTATERIPSHCIYADYGYAITAHKSQGSEWPSVLVYWETIYKTDMARWGYTAITRASEKLTVLIN